MNNFISFQLYKTISSPEHLRGLHVGGEKLFLVTGDGPQLLEWEEYGFRIQVPEGATSGPCDVAVKAIVAGKFHFPMEAELVSAVYAISSSRRLIRPVKVEIQHCVAIRNEQQGHFLSFAKAQCNQESLPYVFQILKNGTCGPQFYYGVIDWDEFSLVSVLRCQTPNYFQASMNGGKISFSLIC